VSNRLIIRPEAEADMTEAFDWYEERKATLGHEFLAEVHTALRAIADHPLHHQVLYKNVRRILTRRFPYKVFFLVEAEQVEVIAIIHAKRHLRIWQKRFSSSNPSTACASSATAKNWNPSRLPLPRSQTTMITAISRNRPRSWRPSRHELFGFVGDEVTRLKSLRRMRNDQSLLREGWRAKRVESADLSALLAGDLSPSGGRERQIFLPVR